MEMDEVHINEPYAVYGPGTVEYGRNVFVAEHAWLSLATEHALVTVGDNTQLGRFFSVSCVQRIDIGASCLIAERVFMTDTGHRYEDIQTPIIISGLMEGRPIKIEDDVWIGIGVAILPGVTIGHHSIIGANSVVNRDVPPYCVVAGNPARIIKQYNQLTNCWELTSSKTKTPSE